MNADAVTIDSSWKLQQQVDEASRHLFLMVGAPKKAPRTFSQSAFHNFYINKSKSKRPNMDANAGEQLRLPYETI